MKKDGREVDIASQEREPGDIAVLVFDHDNCVLQAVSELSTLEINSLFSHLLITSKALPSSFQWIYLAIGSLRQSVWYDRYAMLFNALIEKQELKLNGSIFHSLNQLTALLEKSYPQKIRRQPLVLADCLQTETEKEMGSYLDSHSDDFCQDMTTLTAQIAQSIAMINGADMSFLKWLQQQQACAGYLRSSERMAEIERHWLHVLGTNDAFFDKTKLITLFIHAHDMANKHPDQSIKLIFVDDLEKYAKYFSSILKHIPYLIPSNVMFTPVQYVHSSMNICSSVLLSDYENTGTGQVDRDYQQTALSWGRVCEQEDLNEWVISKHLIARMRSHFKALMPSPLEESSFLPTPSPVSSFKSPVRQLLLTNAPEPQRKLSKGENSESTPCEVSVGDASQSTNSTLQQSMSQQFFGAAFIEQETSPKVSAAKPFSALRKQRYSLTSFPRL